MKTKRTSEPDAMRAEYDFDYSKAVRGKYYRRLMSEGLNVVVLDPDVAKAFRSSAAVNKALRSLLEKPKPGRRGIRGRAPSGAARTANAQTRSRTSRR